MNWLNNGQSVKVPVGNYRIEFKELEGFQTPSNIVVSVNKNETTNINVEYLPISSGGGIVGVQDTGTRSANGAGLRWVTTSGDNLVERNDLDTDFFDAHSSFQFTDEILGTNNNYFVKIPRAYWWRGLLPDTANPGQEKWTMLISSVPTTWNGKEFTAQSAAFKRDGNWMDQFYYGKYRGSAGYGSKPGATHLGSVSWDNWVSGCNALGNGHHLASIQEYFEILGRMVIEKKTFQLFPEAVRGNQSLCKYRGVEDLAYGVTVYSEWMNGLRTNASNIITLWQEAGGNYVTTGKAIGSGNYIHSLQDGDLFDHLFLAKTVGAEATSFIPDHNYSVANRVCFMDFGPSGSHRGAFYAGLSRSSSNTHSAIGGRVARW